MKKTSVALALIIGTLHAFAAPLSPAGTAAATRTLIQNAVDSAASGSSVELGAGLFEIDQPLTVANGVRLVGQGWTQTVIRPASGKSIRCVTLEGGAKLEGVTLTGATQSGALVTDGTISWCCLSNNTVSSKAGAGVSFTSGKGGVDHSLFVNNRVTSGWGAAVGAQTPAGPITVDTCLLYGNAANGGSGGGVGLPGSIGYDCTVRNCTIVGNTGAYYGPGVFRSGDGGVGKVILVNTILAGNKKGTNERNLDTNSNLDMINSRNCWFGLDEDLAGSVPNSYYGAPSFVNAAANDYRLAEGSKAIRAGAKNTGVGLDLGGAEFDTLYPSMGCYEYGRVKRISGFQFVYRDGVDAGADHSSPDVTFVGESAADAWFDAGVEELVSWPSSGKGVVVAGQGAWCRTRNAALAEDALAVRSVETEGLLFSPAFVRSVESATLHGEATLTFTVAEGAPAAADGRFGLTVASVAGATGYYGLVKRGASSVWVALAGATPKTEPVLVGFDVKKEGGLYKARYTVDGVTLTAEGAEWSEITGFARAAGQFGFLGTGSVSRLAASCGEETTTCSLTVPAIDNVGLKHVRRSGEEIVASEPGVYSVLKGSVITVTFAAAEGFALTADSMTFVVEEDMTLPTTGRPVAVDPSVISVNEFVAKNSESLRTRDGFAGLDWVELRNTGDLDVDVSSWYLGNDPTKSTGKWPKIKGRCVVPAHGFKIVWCDGDELCSRYWLDDEAHAVCNLSTDADKHVLFLAATDSRDAIVDQVAVPGGLEDVSYGRSPTTGAWFYFREPTPGVANTTEQRNGFTSPVVFSEPHGYKEASFQLTMSCPADPTAPIYYTLDGKSPVPGASGTVLYSSPITISKTTVVRAVAYDAQSVLQVDVSASYLFLSDILTQGTSAPAGFPASGAVNGQKMLYGMRDASTLGDPDAAARLRKGFLDGIRTVSIVIDPANLFDKDKGIYVNAMKSGREWERQTMIEQICPTDATDEFSVPCGLRIRGNSSRLGTNVKHSFRLCFRSDYGMRTLRHPLFGDEGSDEYEIVDLRSEQDSSWANGNNGNTLITELFSRDSQRDMGQSHNRSRYYHLFLNGVYWGVYQTEERVTPKYGADYNGGNEDNYDIVRTQRNIFKTVVVDGEPDAWRDFWNITMNEGYGAGHEANYNRVRGLDPDGTPNGAYPVYLNVTNLICYLLTSQFVADGDCPAGTAYGGANNIVAYRNRVSGDGDVEGFFWNRHDAENSMGHGQSGGAYDSGTKYMLTGTRAYVSEKYPQGVIVLEQFNPQGVHYELCANAEYKRTFADLVQKHLLTPGGAMTVEAASARYRARMSEIDDAVMGELARWGGTFTRKTWLGACGGDLTFITNRIPYVISAYRQLGWFPSIDAPTADVASGTVPSGTVVTFAAAGTDGVYVTTDGSDPSSASAPAAGGKVTLTKTGVVKARAKKGSEWSALVELSFVVTGTANQEQLRFLEIYGSTTGDGDTDEYIVLTNLSAKAVQLEGLVVSSAKHDTKKGVIETPKCQITLGLGTVPAYGSVKLEQSAYASAGWTKITNGNVFLKLVDAAGTTVQSGYASFDNAKYPDVDGLGAALVAIRFDTALEDTTDCWTSSKAKKPVDPVDPTADWYVSPTGDDANAGTSVAAPFKTIAKAVASASAGQTVGVLAGTYEISAEISVNKAITIAGQGWTNTVIKVAAGKNVRCFTLDGGARLEGVTLTGGRLIASGENGAGALVRNGTISWCCISNNTVSVANIAGAGVSFTGGQGAIDHSIVANNTITGGSWGAGVGAYGNAGTILIDACLVYGNADKAGSGGGVGLKNISNDCVIRNCTIVGNQGLYAGGGVFRETNTGKLVLINTILVGNEKTFSSVAEADLSADVLDKTNSKNCFFGLSSDVSKVTGSISGDPKFVNAANRDYRLQESSPAKGAGATYTGIGRDLDGRAFAATPSVGCYEYGNAPVVEDWDHPSATIDASTTAGTAWPSLANSTLSDAKAAKLRSWAKNVGQVGFSEKGAILTDAFLLNCANTQAAVEAAKADFTFSSFDPANPPTAETFASKNYNGVVTIEGRPRLDVGAWAAKTKDDRFFRAVLTIK